MRAAVIPQHPFDYLYKELQEPGRTPGKSCGVGTSIATYDVDGRCYPCHLFVPIVHGRDAYDEIAALDFSDAGKLLSPACSQCPIRMLCRTCYGYNYI